MPNKKKKLKLLLLIPFLSVMPTLSVVAKAASGLETAQPWTVLFRSDDPTIWNTRTDREGHFAVPIGEVNEDIIAIVTSNESKAFASIEPFDGSGQCFCHSTALLKGS